MVHIEKGIEFAWAEILQNNNSAEICHFYLVEEF